MNPGWLEQVQRQNAARLVRLQNGVQQVERPIRDSFHTAPGWRQVAFLLSCEPDIEHPWDPVVVKKIWEFDKSVVPMWVRWVFAPPDKDGEADQVVFGRHMIGRYDPTLKAEAVDFPCTMPRMPCQGITFPKPNILELPWMVYVNGSPYNSQYPKNFDLPGDYLPFDNRLVKWLKESYYGRTSQSGKQFAQAIIAEQVAFESSRKAALEAEDNARREDLEGFVTNKLEQVSEVELKEHLLGRGV